MVDLRVQAGSTLSNVDIIKLHLYYDGPATPEELARSVAKLMRATPDENKALDKYVLPVLQSQPMFVKMDDKYEIDLQLMPEHRVVSKILGQVRKFLSEKELKSAIAKELMIKVGSVAIEPSRVQGLKQFNRKWGLAHWKLINDQAYELMRTRHGSFSEAEVVKLVVNAGFAKENEAIFDPTGDNRFRRERKNWQVVTHDDASSKKKPPVKMKVISTLDKVLEKDFIRSQTGKDAVSTATRASSESSKLKKVLIKRLVFDKIKEREAAPQMQDSVFKRFPDVVSRIGGDVTSQADFDKIASYHRIDDSPRETSLSARERSAIMEFLVRISNDPEIAPLNDAPVALSGPLSAPKVERIVYQRYRDYSALRTVIPDDYNRLLVELMSPRISDFVLNPACQTGALAIQVLHHLNEALAGSYWALGDNDSLFILNHRGEKVSIDARDTPLIDKVKEQFTLTRNDLLANFVSYNFCGIESDAILSHAARIVARLSSYENVYIVNREFLTELPEVFGQPPNPENDIDLVFNVILGNVTFKGNHNVVANYIDQACRILAADGRIGFFLRWDFMHLMDGHPFLKAVMSRHSFDTVIKISGIQSDVDTAIAIITPRASEDIPGIKYAEISSPEDIPRLLSALKSGSGGDKLKVIPGQDYSALFR